MIVTYIESVQKHRKLSQDSVDTFNSLIWESLFKLYDILHCLKLFLYEWLHVKYSRAVRSQFDALGVLGSKSWIKQTPIFPKKGGLSVCSPDSKDTLISLIWPNSADIWACACKHIGCMHNSLCALVGISAQKGLACSPDSKDTLISLIPFNVAEIWACK